MGLDLGLNEAGLRVAVSRDMDKWCIETMRRNSHLAIDGDIRDLIESDPSCSSFCRPVVSHAKHCLPWWAAPPTLLHGRQTQGGGRTRPAGQEFIKVVLPCARDSSSWRTSKGWRPCPATPQTSNPSLCWTPSWVLQSHRVPHRARHFGCRALRLRFRERLVIVGSRDGRIFLPAPTRFNATRTRHALANPRQRHQ